MTNNDCEGSKHWPDDVGILAIEIYFPKTFVCQQKLEEFDGVSKGKYTIGLGQSRMGFCGDREDINSLALTVVQSLFERNSIDPKDVGRLEVGTETLIDKSKSVKTVLMQLFEESGNTEVEGVDTTNACYGGTQAFFNALAWIESSAWDGRLAVVVAADIAVYAAGNARSSGGAGAVAMLVGPNAPLVVERGLRSVHMQHAYDFYKPNMSSEYPVVDGKLSVKCYFQAVDHCYKRYKEKLAKKESQEKINISAIDYMVFHTPFCKIVQKCVARMVLADFLDEQEPEMGGNGCYQDLSKYRGLSLKETLEKETLAKEIERASVKASQQVFNAKALPSINIARDVGNMYTPSLYSGLVSLLYSILPSDLAGKRIGMYSYGSGLASSMFSLRVAKDLGPGSPLRRLLASVEDVPSRLTARSEVLPEDFVKTLEIREKAYHANSYTPVCPLQNLFPGSFYLENIDNMFRRTYSRKLKVDVSE